MLHEWLGSLSTSAVDGREGLVECVAVLDRTARLMVHSEVDVRALDAAARTLQDLPGCSAFARPARWRLCVHIRGLQVQVWRRLFAFTQGCVMESCAFHEGEPRFVRQAAGREGDLELMLLRIPGVAGQLFWT
jgi:hypothetical protein